MRLLLFQMALTVPVPVAVAVAVAALSKPAVGNSREGWVLHALKRV